ncbi:FKBP-type peptidyl-prolyl cis-trans isomerase N-terminal domain-containing protein [Haloferula chungangensis]|uniref:Peptidyl-prolyl cis-trans isomerase n=1 Tax=Haloferula chungangensis TaxID=1048331 RepID=A0ABW2L571_9BACT
MKPQIIPGVLALSLAASLAATAQDEAAPAAEKPKAVSPPVAVPPPAAPPMDPAEMKTQSSYGLGYRTGGEFGQRWGSFGVTTDDIDNAKFLEGFMAGFQGDEPGIDAEKLGAAMQALGNMLQEREKALGEKNAKDGAAFLEENGKKDGIVTTDSGLQYQILEKGGDTKYAAPKEGEAEKQFLVNYKGSLIDGTEFDASPEGQPVPMTLQVVEGFKEALTMMPVGAKWKLFVPGKLAYGEQRRSADIGPNQTLIFELELVSIEDAPAPQHPGGMPFPMPGQGQ